MSLFPKILIFLSLLNLQIDFATAAGGGDGGGEISARSIRATTFNIRWFGLGGSMQGSPANEHRDQSIKEFLATEVMPTDVIAFQEIVDVNRLRALLPSGWTCVGYTNSDQKHQHVELCAAPQFSLQKVAYDNNFAIETVTLNRPRSRAAVRADLVEKSTGRKLMRVIAVHLKAYPDESNTREAQATKIAEDISIARDSIPTLVLGDFNTYPASDDISRIESALAKASIRFPLRHIAHSESYTYRSDRHRSQFDHFYLTEDANVLMSPWVFSVCNGNKSSFTNFRYYYDNVSDHCPTTVDIRLPN